MKNKVFLNNFFIFVLGFFFIFTSFIYLLNTKEGIPPDEDYHIKLSKIFSQKEQTLFLKDSEATYELGAVSRTPFLYHFVLGKLLILNNFFNLTKDYLFLRIINLIFGLLFIFCSYKFLHILNSNWFEKIFVYLMFLHTTMLTLLYGSVSYDNLINLLSVISFILILKFNKNKKLADLLKWSIISSLGSLSKFSYVPLVVIQLLFVINILLNKIAKFNKKALKEWFNKELNNRINLTYILVLIIFASINFYYYGINIIKYKNILPKCDQILTEEECINNKIYAREDNIRKLNEGKILPLNELLTIKEYYYYVYNTQVSNMYDLFTHDYIHADKNSFFFLPLIFFVGLFLNFYYQKNRNLRNFLILTILIYFTILFSELYKSYLINGIKPLGVQGRYLFPIIVPIYYLLAFGFNNLFKNKISKIFFLIFIFILLNQIIYRPIFHGMMLKPESYGENRSMIILLNEKILYKIPRIQIF